MPFMPAFNRRKTAAALVGKIIAGYGELEFLLAYCVGIALADKRPIVAGLTKPQHRIKYEHRGIKLLFRLKGAEKRLKKAKRLLKPFFAKHGLQTEFAEAFRSLDRCRLLRNDFAHSNWAQSKKQGLFFASLEETARSPAKLQIRFRHTSVKTLQEIQRHFLGTFEWLSYLHYQGSVNAGLLRGASEPPPPRITPLKERKYLFPLKSPH